MMVHIKPHIEVIEPKLFEAVVADEIVAAISDAIADRGRATVVLAGGGTPAAVYRLLGRPPRAGDVAWDRVVFYLGDERWVAQTDTQSNAKMVHDTMLHGLTACAPTFFSVDTSCASSQEGAEHYEKLIRDQEKLPGGSFPCFDLVLLGMGEDGHTASLFPGAPILAGIDSGAGLESEALKGKICVAVRHAGDAHPGFISERVSMTPRALFGAKRVLFLVRGESKAQMLQRVLEGADAIAELPARLWIRASNSVTWFVDSEAATALSVPRS